MFIRLLGREPTDAMSLPYADTSHPDLLGRMSLHYADQGSAMRPEHLLCSKRASTAYLKSWLLCLMKNFNNFLLRSAA